MTSRSDCGWGPQQIVAPAVWDLPSSGVARRILAVVKAVSAKHRIPSVPRESRNLKEPAVAVGRLAYPKSCYCCFAKTCCFYRRGSWRSCNVSHSTAVVVSIFFHHIGFLFLGCDRFSFLCLHNLSSPLTTLYLYPSTWIVFWPPWTVAKYSNVELFTLVPWFSTFFAFVTETFEDFSGLVVWFLWLYRSLSIISFRMPCVLVCSSPWGPCRMEGEDSSSLVQDQQQLWSCRLQRGACNCKSSGHMWIRPNLFRLLVGGPSMHFERKQQSLSYSHSKPQQATASHNKPKNCICVVLWWFEVLSLMHNP